MLAPSITTAGGFAFQVKRIFQNNGSLGRSGLLTNLATGVSQATPCVLICTNHLSPLHLTPDNLALTLATPDVYTKKLWPHAGDPDFISALFPKDNQTNHDSDFLYITKLIEVNVEDLFEAPALIEAWSKLDSEMTINKFAGLPRGLWTMLARRDPFYDQGSRVLRPPIKQNSAQEGSYDLQVMCTNKGGVQPLGIKGDMMRIARITRPNLICAPVDNSKGGSKKRTILTEAYAKLLISEAQLDNQQLIVSFCDSIKNSSLASPFILGTAFAASRLDKDKLFNPEKLRIFRGQVDSLKHIVTLFTQHGIDIFDSSYCDWLTTQGKALYLPNITECQSINQLSQYLSNGNHDEGFAILNMWEDHYEIDQRPLQHDCQCVACGAEGQHEQYMRAYVNHLLKCKEMLANILLASHNLRQLCLFVAHLGKLFENESN